jgi:transposase
MVVDLSVRRLYCENSQCPRATFVEQVAGLTVRYRRRTPALQRVVEAVAVHLAGMAGARLLLALHQVVSWSTLLRCLMALPVPQLPVPRVLGVDDFSLRRGHRFATILIDALTHRRVDVLPDRLGATLAGWLRTHPGVEVVCRDGSASYAQAITDALPEAVQISDRWHLWHGLGEAVEKTVAAHACCWRTTGTEVAPDSRNQRTLSRHAAVHDLLEAGAGLGECARRLGLALNTIKRYARAAEADQLIRPPAYRSCLVDPYRDHLRRRLAEEPDLPRTHLLAEIRAMGYTGSAKLLVRYLNQHREQDPLPDPSIRRLTGWIMTRPDRLSEQHRAHRDQLAAACPQMTALVRHVETFAHLITQPGGDLQEWIDAARTDDLPALHSFINGLDKDRQAVQTGVTLPYSNGATEGVNTKIKLLKRQTYGRAGFALLRQRILLN